MPITVAANGAHRFSKTVPDLGDPHRQPLTSTPPGSCYSNVQSSSTPRGDMHGNMQNTSSPPVTVPAYAAGHTHINSTSNRPAAINDHSAAAQRLSTSASLQHNMYAADIHEQGSCTPEYHPNAGFGDPVHPGEIDYGLSYKTFGLWSPDSGLDMSSSSDIQADASKSNIEIGINHRVCIPNSCPSLCPLIPS